METANRKNLRGIIKHSKIDHFIKVFFLLLSGFCVTKVNAQLNKQMLNMSQNRNFKEILNSETHFLDSLKLDTDSSIYFSGGGEYKNFLRFRKLWEPRLYSNKKFDTYLQAEQAYYETTSSNYTSASSEPWRELGPKNSSVGNGPAEFISFFDNGTPASTQFMLAGSIPGGLFYSKDFGETWSPTGTDFWERSGCSWAVFNPTNHLIWCASSSGNSTNGASSWIGRTGGVYLTTDEGKTWEKKADYLDFGQWTIIRKIIYDPSNSDKLFVATSDGLYRTDNLTNSDPTWVKVLAYDVYDLEMKPGNNNIIYVTCKQTINNTTSWKVMKSIDQGSTWNELYNENNNIMLTIEVSKAKPEYLYMCKISSSYCNICYYYNNTWTTVLTGSLMNFGGGHAFGVEQVQNGENIVISYSTYLKKPKFK